MFLYNPSQLLRKGSITLPYEVRAAVGWHDGTILHISATDGPRSGSGNELVFSPIPLASRADLWHLTVLFNDRPGLISELSALLKALHIDIISLRATTRRQATRLALQIDFDARLYASTYDATTIARSVNPGRRLDELEARIFAQFVEDLVFKQDGRSAVRIDRHRQLGESGSAVTLRGSATLRDGAVPIPGEILSELRARSEAMWPSLAGGRAQPRAFVIAEPVVSIVRVLIHWPDTGHVHLRVTTRDGVGTVAAIATALNRSGFNILQMYTRQLGGTDNKVSDLLITLPAEIDKAHDDKALRRFVRATLVGGGLRSKEVSVTFPSLYRRPALARPKKKGRKK